MLRQLLFIIISIDMFKKGVIITVLIFAGIGMAFSGVFVAMQFGWLNVRGTIAERNQSLRQSLVTNAINKADAEGS